MLHMSFKFRANSYVKLILSKTQENSKLNTKYLKGIIIEQLFIFSMRDYLHIPIIYSILKNKMTHLKQT
jgi:hypothetical protein